MDLGVYVHIPYCASKCDYCAFHSTSHYTVADQRRIVEKILGDARVVAETLETTGFAAQRARSTTVYIGGGTPSVLEHGALTRIARGLQALTGEPQEITCEANPHSCSKAFIEECGEAGVHRLSIGVQTLNDSLAGRIGRATTTADVLASIRRNWMNSLSADLIIGMPGQTTREALEDVTRICDLGFDHVSVYDLVLEPGTPLSRRVGARSLPDLNWQRVRRALVSAGLCRYEVSNFSRHGHESLHNLGYWRMEPYVGLGPAAVSTINLGSCTVRISQSQDHSRFLRDHPIRDADREELSAAMRKEEFLMLGLRTREGVSRARFRLLFHEELDDRFPAWETLAAEGYLRSAGDTLSATDLGMDFLDPVLARFFAGDAKT